MKRIALLFVAVAAFTAVGARADDMAGTKPDAGAQTMKETKESREAKRKAAWENGVKTDCAAEIGSGGVCEGKDFGTGLEKCLNSKTNRKKLSDGCRVAVRHHKEHEHKGKEKKHHDKGGDDSSQAPAPAPAAAPAPSQ